MDLERLLDFGEAHARARLLEEGRKELTPFYHLSTPPGEPDAIVMVDFKDEQAKQISFAAVKQIARRTHAVAALFISESWMVNYTKEEAAATRRVTPPSEDPRRVEIVMILVTDGRTYRNRALLMKRDRPGGELLDLVRDEELINLGGRALEGIIDPGQ
jgi:hypothetical protein